MDFVCAKCNEKIEKTSFSLSTGCTNCGSKVFTTGNLSNQSLEPYLTSPISQVEVQGESNNIQFKILPTIQGDDSYNSRLKELGEDNIPAIKLKEKGVYEVNIEGLFTNAKSDPIILSGKSGVYRVEFLSVKERVKK